MDEEQKRAAKREYLKRWQEANREHRKAYQEATRERRNQRRRERYAQDELYRDKAKKQAREWQAANPEKRKEQRIKKAHGLDLSDYTDLLIEQDNQCAICGYTDRSDKNFFPLLDHCHQTGKVRGLLCMSCNQGLGKFKDDPELLLAAIAYLQRNG